MSDLISRDKLIEAIENQCFDWMHYTTCMYFINAQPPVEPVRGEWIKQDDTYTKFMCSNCGSFNHPLTYDFCPNCGADMRGEKNGDV